MSEVEVSDSGKYILEITSQKTRPGCWNYTTGTVRKSDGTQIAVVKRNYSAFPFLFIEGHPNGHDYLICGEDYQGQTVIELDTRERRDFLPESAAKGNGFCWVEYKCDDSKTVLIVLGCYWACPYEYRFYDFSDPIKNGCPQIEFEDESEYIDNNFEEINLPVVLSDGKFQAYITRDMNENLDTEEEDWQILETKTWERDGLKLKLIDHHKNEELISKHKEHHPEYYYIEEYDTEDLPK